MPLKYFIISKIVLEKLRARIYLKNIHMHFKDFVIVTLNYDIKKNIKFLQIFFLRNIHQDKLILSYHSCFINVEN